MFQRFFSSAITTKLMKKAYKPRNFSKLVKKQYSKDLVKDTLESSNISSIMNWKSLRQAILDHEDNRGQYSIHNIDAMILNYCLSNNRDLGLSYINFMTKENMKKNLATVGKHLQLIFSENTKYLQDGQKCPDSEETLILEIYTNLRKDHPILDPLTLESCIVALSLTCQWKKCVELIKEVEISSTPSSKTYGSIIAAAFINNEHDFAWNLLENLFSKNKVPSLPFITYINLAKKSQQRTAMLEKLLLFFQETDYICNEDVVLNLSQLVQVMGMRGSPVYVSLY